MYTYKYINMHKDKYVPIYILGLNMFMNVCINLEGGRF